MFKADKEYEEEKEKIKKYAETIDKRVINGYLSPSIKNMKSELKLDNREMALVYNELGLKKTIKGEYEDAKSIYLEAIKEHKDLPIIYYGLGVVLVKLYEKKRSEKELKEAEKNFKKAKSLIKKKKLELFLSQELNSIDDELQSLDPPLLEYPNILRRSIVNWLEKIISSSQSNIIMPQIYNNNNTGANIANFSNQVQDSVSQQANQHIDNENKNN